MKKLSINDIKLILEDIIELYAKANKDKIKAQKGLIIGRKQSISSQVQILFGKKLINVLKSPLVLVDCALSYKLNKNKIIYPDVLILDRNNKAKIIIELKMDPGYIDLEKFKIKKTKSGTLEYRGGETDLSKQYNKFINSKKFSYYKLEETNGELKKIKQPVGTINSSVKKIFIFITKDNHPDRIEPMKRAVIKSGFKFFCFMKKHPNTIGIDKNDQNNYYEKEITLFVNILNKFASKL